MMGADNSLDRERYFNELYAKNPDPWRYHDCDYEVAKRADTLSFLRSRYANGCEIGCSIGVLSADLAPRCDHLLAVDISPAAAALARVALGGHRNVEVRVMHLPGDRPAGRFDLLVLSEVLYFFDEAELAAMAALAGDMVVPNGDVIIVSYDGETQTRLNGRAATDLFLAHAVDFELIESVQREQYHVRLLRRRRQ